MATITDADRALRRLPTLAKEAAQKVMDVTAFNVARGAQARAPVRTGALKRGIQWQSRPRMTRAVVGVVPTAFHWRYLEYGTVKITARPFIRPAAEAEKSDHQSRMLRALDQAGHAMARSAESRFL